MKMRTTAESEPDLNAPNKDRLEAFNLTGSPILLPGGGGQTYRVNQAVLKPAGNIQLMSWLANITENLRDENFRIPKPLKTASGSWTHEGWIAHEYIEGFHKNDNFTESISVCRDFHQAISQIPKPAFYDQLDDPFHLPDKMVWGELPLPDYDLTNAALKKLFRHFQPIQAPNQLIHGDWGFGNILFHQSQKPAIIDLTPYFRPADLPIAGMLVHAILEGENPQEIFSFAKDIKEFDQLLLRAIAKEILQWVNFQLHPENDHDRSPEIIKRMHLIDLVIKYHD